MSKDKEPTAIAEQYIGQALALGATDAIAFKTEDIVFDPRTLIKCMFGCSSWGIEHTCPSRPGALKPWEYQRIFERYGWGIIVHSNDKRISQKVSLAIESQAFVDGYYFAFSLSDCGLCSECAGYCNKACRFPKKARPAFHSVGIDVFATVRKFGLPIDTLANATDPQDWYSAIFIE